MARQQETENVHQQCGGAAEAEPRLQLKRLICQQDRELVMARASASPLLRMAGNGAGRGSESVTESENSDNESYMEKTPQPRKLAEGRVLNFSPLELGPTCDEDGAGTTRASL